MIRRLVASVVKVVTITEDNDPNNKIGRPGGYTSAAVIFAPKSSPPWLDLPYHRGIADGTLPPSIGGIGQSRTLMLLLHKAHLGEVSVTVWPQVLKEMCAAPGVHLLE